ncbi:hypothetical protein HK102_012675, partial [Quaeritorhiza haematococci]
ALTLLNDPSFFEGARVLAGRVLAETGSTRDEDRLDGLFKIVLARPILPAERVSLLTFLAERRRAFREDPAAVEALLKVGRAPAPEDADPAEAAAWAATCRVVLNLHETITRY